MTEQKKEKVTIEVIPKPEGILRMEYAFSVFVNCGFMKNQKTSQSIMQLVIFLFCNFFLLQSGQACQIENEICAKATHIDGTVLSNNDCLTGCNASTVPGNFDPTLASCQGSPFGTAWYKIDSDKSARILTVELSSAELNRPILVLYQGTCDDLVIVDCNSAGGVVELRNLTLEGDVDYWLAVSSADGTEGEFELCTEFSPDENVCNNYSALEIKSTSLGSALSGPYKPGEEVEFCYKIPGYENVGCNFLHGIIPLFGNGWAPSSFDSHGQPINITKPLETQGHTNWIHYDPYCEGDPAGSWEWFDTGVKYNLNSENTMGYVSDQDIAPGWVFVNSFDPSCFEFDDACCVNPTSDPNVGYGDDDYPVCGRGMTQEWEVCLTLTTRANPNCEDELDCRVGFKTFSDGELGTFIDKSCKRDRVTYFNAANTCCTAPSLSADSKILTACPDETVTFEINADDPDARFYWYDQNEELHLTTDTGTAQLELSADTEGTHIYKVFATNGCASEAIELELNIESSIAASIIQEPSIVCAGEPVTLRAALDDGTLLSETSFTWNDDDSSSGEELEILDSEKTYQVELAYKNCSTVLEHDLNTYPVSTVEMEGSTGVCAGDRAFLKLALSGSGPWTIILESNTGETKELTVQDATYLDAVETTEDFSYEIISAVDANGCAMDWQGEFIVEVTEPLDISAGDDLYIHCDQPVELEGEMLSNVQDYSMQWSYMDGTPVISEDGSYMVNDPGLYILEAVDQTFCVTRDTIQVSESPDELEVTLAHASEIFVAEGESTLLEININLPSTEIASIIWTGPDDFSCSDCLSSMVSPSEDGVYYVEVTDIHGCTDLREITVKLTDLKSDIYLPTIFNPAAVGDDSKFTIFHDGSIEKISSMEIFDRWGNKVFQSYDSYPGEDSACWNGTANGQLLSQGVYVYQFVLEMSDGPTQTIRGQLTLLR